jgi:hypothetical protein
MADAIDIDEMFARSEAKHFAKKRAVNSDGKPRPPKFSDESLALKFAEQHAKHLRHIAAWGRWLQYDGQRWHLDSTLQAFDYARHICRSAAAACESKMAKLIASAKTVAAVERLARADRRMAASIDQLDSNPSLLNTGENHDGSATFEQFYSGGARLLRALREGGHATCSEGRRRGSTRRARKVKRY